MHAEVPQARTHRALFFFFFFCIWLKIIILVLKNRLNHLANRKSTQNRKLQNLDFFFFFSGASGCRTRKSVEMSVSYRLIDISKYIFVKKSDPGGKKKNSRNPLRIWLCGPRITFFGWWRCTGLILGQIAEMTFWSFGVPCKGHFGTFTRIYAFWPAGGCVWVLRGA